MESIKQGILQGQFHSIFHELYCSQEAAEQQKLRYIHALQKFEALYGKKQVEIYSAPGRTEICGNHTDHQNGKVLAASIDLDAVAVVSKREDNIVHIKSEGYDEFEIHLSDLEIKQEEIGTTQALVRGVANGIKRRGYTIGGFNAYITSEVLSGSGLSSSAAYEVLIGNILSGLYNKNQLDSILIAQIGQEAERTYFGKPCGLMDQMACSVGGMIYIDFAEKEKPLVKKLEVDFNAFCHCLCIVDTKGSHADLTDEYAAVPEEMKKVAHYFGKELLGEITESEFLQNLAQIRKTVGDRALLRTLHWFAENERVEAQVLALEQGEFDRFKQLIKESGNSSFKYLQNVYSTKNIEEQSVSLALGLSDMFLANKGVSRVHGGGFAGTIQAFVPKEMVKEYKAFMECIYGAESCHVLHIRPIGGIKIV